MPAHDQIDAQEREQLPLSKSAQMLLEECRMVLPGLQALFGFQLVAVFNSAFDQKLSVTGQHLHFAALTLVAIAIALIMAPAAFHRQVGVTEITGTFIKVSTRLVLMSMLPLMLGVTSISTWSAACWSVACSRRGWRRACSPSSDCCGSCCRGATRCSASLRRLRRRPLRNDLPQLRQLDRLHQVVIESRSRRA